MTQGDAGGSVVERNGEANSSADICVDLSGDYAVTGRPLPGMPDHYVVNSIRPTMDALLGLELDRATSVKLERARIVQDPNALHFVFSGRNVEPVLKLFDHSTGFVNCNAEKVVIQNVTEGAGEAVSGVATITRTLNISKNGGLVVRVTFVWRNRTLFVFWTQKEEYGVEYPSLSAKR